MTMESAARAASQGEPESAGPARERTAAETGSRLRRISFYVAIALTSLFLLVMLLPAYPLIAINWLPDDLWLAVRTDRGPGDQIHRLHSMALSFLAWGMLVGVAAQFHRPRRNPAALLMALAVPVALAFGEVIMGTYEILGLAPFLLLPLLIAVLHPARAELVRLPRLNPFMGVSAAVAAVPLVLFAVGFGEGGRIAGPDFEADHLHFMASLSVLAALWAAIGAFKLPGWPFPAAAAVVVIASIGLQSLLFSGVLSGVPRPWAVAALAWCLGYGAAAVRRMHHGRGAHSGAA